MLQAKIACHGLTAIVGCVQDVYAWVAVCPLAQELWRGIGGTVVNADNLIGGFLVLEFQFKITLPLGITRKSVAL